MPKENCCQTVLKFIVIYVAFPLLSPLLILLAPFYRAWDKFTFEWFQSRNVCTPAEHRRKVAHVQDQVRAWNAGGRKARMCTARAEWASFSVHHASKRDLARIQVDHLHHVAEIDTVNGVVTVEPGLMMGQLTSILISHGWTIPVVPEFETLTVGGTVCGTGIESNSTRCGLSGDSAVGFEVVLSNGDVVNCSKDENSDLFYSIPWSHGTLGFLTAVKFPLIPAKKYVQVQYHATESYTEAKALLETQDHEFVEGIAYGRRKFVVTHGKLTDHGDSRRGTVNHINRWYKPFWYKHVESFLRRSRGGGGGGKVKEFIEYVPLRDYYHRHTRVYFWEVTANIPYLNAWLFRYLFGWLLPAVDVKTAMRFAKIIKMDWLFEMFYLLNHVVQDFIVPMKHLEAAIDFSHETVEIYPLWLCPCKVYMEPRLFHARGGSDELYVDVGIYGNVPDAKKAAFHPEMTIRKLEAFTLDHDGSQFMYADSFLTREEFGRMFDLELYDAVRAKYSCLDAFPHVYDKVSKQARGIQV